MFEWPWAIVGILAVWRIAHIGVYERIARPVRKLLGERADKETGLFTYPDNFFGYLISCFMCLSVWVGVAVTIILFIYPPVLLPFALSAVAIFIEDRR